MARVIQPIIPPSMAEALGALIGRTGRGNTGLLHAARQAQAAERPSSATATRQAAARWLADRWRGTLPTPARSAFYADRYAELVRQEFDPFYWNAITPTMDVTQKSTPNQITPWTGPQNPTYTDPLHRQTFCRYGKTSSAYATPGDAGTDEQPAPGWRGETSGGYFQDLWHAQQTFAFTLIVPIRYDDRRPLLVATQTHIEAEATTRGNKNWFAVSIATYPLTQYGLPRTNETRAITRWDPSTQPPINIPDANPNGWQHAITTLRIRDGMQGHPFKRDVVYTQLQVWVSTPPSLGLYGARNDAVRVIQHSTCTLYQARTPHG